MTKIIATSDTHGYLPKIGSCDIFIHAGDICPLRDHSVARQRTFLDGPFKEWLWKIDARSTFWCGGNHDFALADQANHEYTNILRVILNNPKNHRGVFWYLQDNSQMETGYFDNEATFMNVWGSPWVNMEEFPGWAFSRSEADLEKIYSQIPADTDILITHGPPYGYGDYAHGQHLGSPSLLRKVLEVQPKYHFFGHIHEGFGEYQIGATRAFNVSYLDGNYQVAHDPVEIII